MQKIQRGQNWQFLPLWSLNSVCTRPVLNLLQNELYKYNFDKYHEEVQINEFVKWRDRV